MRNGRVKNKEKLAEEYNGDQAVGENEEKDGDDLMAGEESEDFMAGEKSEDSSAGEEGEDLVAGEVAGEEKGENLMAEEEGEAIEKLVEEEKDKDGNEDAKEEKKNEEDISKENKNEENAVEVGEKMEEGKEKEAADNVKPKENIEKKVEENSTGKVIKPRKRIRKKKVLQGAADKLVSKDENKPESSVKKNISKKVESMGMIFMCTSKTKKDCYRYKLLGLPAGKKDIVEKIYKGMRLFLFDLDLRLMYGIYKAAGPGGSNIEPKAFKSAFPSQVRFTVLEDCLPLAEEKFKKVIKDNYYSGNKFHCELTSEQVKKLCKLFVSASKGSALQKGHISEGQDKSIRQGRVANRGLKRRDRDEEMGRKRHDRDEGRSRKRPDLDEKRGRKRRGRREERKSPLRQQRRNHDRPAIYANDFPSQVAPLHIGHQLPAPLYGYQRTLEMNPYRREPVVDHRGLRLVDLEPRHPDESKNRDPYLSYREREAPSYPRPLYASASEREYYTPAVLPAAYRPGAREAERRTTSGLRDYYQPETLSSEYLSLQREVEYLPLRREVEYRPTADLPAEYHSTRALPTVYPGSRSLLAEYRAAGLATEDLAPAGLSTDYRRVGPATEYHSSAGALRDYHPLRSAHRY